MKVGAVILSRYNSNRLPGKALLEINGKKVLDYILERLERVLESSEIVIATSSEPSDNPIEAFSETRGVRCFRGSLENVADRFYRAAVEQEWDYAVRINGDNIFIDIPLLSSMIQLANTGQYDFISNVKDRTYPKGMSIEIVKLQHFGNLLPQINNSKEYQEHVTAYLYRIITDQSKYHFCYNSELPEAAGIQMALDTPADLERTTHIMEHFIAPHWEYNMKAIMKIWKLNNHEKGI